MSERLGGRKGRDVSMERSDLKASPLRKSTVPESPEIGFFDEGKGAAVGFSRDGSALVLTGFLLLPLSLDDLRNRKVEVLR